MLPFKVLPLANCYRCVLGDSYYFDFTVSQRELFGYNDFYIFFGGCIGKPVYSMETEQHVGDVAGIRYLKSNKNVWMLVRIGSRGEVFSKKAEIATKPLKGEITSA